MKCQNFAKINICLVFFSVFSAQAEIAGQTTHPFQMSPELKSASFESLQASHPDIKKAPAVQARVVEINKTDDFSYLYIERNNKKQWIAGIKVQAKPGDTIKYSENVIMNDFFSKALNRTFTEVIFVSDVTVVN